MTSACAYMRCSSKASLFGDTWERQGESILRCADLQGFVVSHEYREEAVPGKLDEDKRPAFQRMIADCLENGCKVIIVESLDRLAREYRIQESLIIYIATKGLTLISANTGENITEAMMGDPMRRALVQIQGILAELDKNMTIAKLSKARERIRASGKRCEGRKQYGDRPGEPPVLRIMRELRQDGMSPSRIARHLNLIGAQTRQEGKRWHGATVNKILRQKSLTESLQHGGQNL